MKVLVNHSNHPFSHWDERQKAWFDKIIDIPFPNIPPSFSELEVEGIVDENLRKISKLLSNELSDDEVYFYIAGEFSYCFLFIAKIPHLRHHLRKDIKIVVPTTERKTIEKKMEDGTIEKTSIFYFVKWRTISF